LELQDRRRRHAGTTAPCGEHKPLLIKKFLIVANKQQQTRGHNSCRGQNTSPFAGKRCRPHVASEDESARQTAVRRIRLERVIKMADKINWSQARDRTNRGKTHDKVDFPDPAAAPLGTDEEAGGARTAEEDIARAERQREPGHKDNRPGEASARPD
jgi:hypothetical protein